MDTNVKLLYPVKNLAQLPPGVHGATHRHAQPHPWPAQPVAHRDERAQRLMRLSGVGETTATCLLAMIGNRFRPVRGVID